MPSRNLLALLLLFTLTGGVPSPAQTPTPSASPTLNSTAKVDAKAPPPSTADFSKEAYVINHMYIRVLAEADGSGSREHNAEIKMLAEAGVKAFAVLSFTYSSANEVVDLDYVRVRKPDGTVVKTPDYNIQDMPGEVTRSAPLYSDIHEKHVAVKGLAVGDVLEYLVRFRVVKPEVPGQFWYEHSFLKDAIVKEERLEISLPGDKYVKVVSPDFKPDIKTENGRRVYQWTYANLEVKKKDPRQVARRIPPKPSVQVTTFSSWEEIGRWYGSLQTEPLQVTPAIQAKAAELTKGLTTDDAKFRALYNFVALQFHYIGLDFGIGRYQPHAADDVLANGYGDCKDKHTLLASLLKASGYDAWPALIHIYRTLDADVPSPAQFDHVITVIPHDGKFIWLDTTSEVAPYELLLTLLRDKDALVIPTNGAPKIMRTPAASAVPQRQEFTMEGTLGSDGTFKGHVEQSYRGDAEVMMRLALRQVSQSQWNEALQLFSAGMGFGGEVSNVKVSPVEETDKPLHVSYDYLRKNYSDWENKSITPPLPGMGIEMSKETMKPEEPALIGAEGEITYRSKLVLPPGYSIETPKGVDLVEPFAEYHASASLEGSTLITSRHLVVKQREVPLERWESLRDFGKAIGDDEWKAIALSGGGTDAHGTSADLDQKFREGAEALQKNDRNRAQELFQAVIAGNPKYPMAHMSLGMVLLLQGRSADALREWRKEQEISPDDVRAFEIPANYLAQMGRKDEAIEDWRKILKFDPKNQEAALNLSEILTSEGKLADAAVTLEDAVKAMPDSSSLEMALGGAYVKSGAADKGVPHILKAIKLGSDDKGNEPQLLNDAAFMLAENHTHLDVAKECAEKAVAKLDELSAAAADSDIASVSISAEFTAAWDTLGWVYFEMGDDARAESFLHAAWVMGQQRVVGDHLGQVYEKAGKKKMAERMYLQALSAPNDMTNFSSGPAATSSASYEKDRHQILAHYERLTGRKTPPPVAIERLPNGEWTKTPSDELEEAREMKITKTTTLAGVADFSIVFEPGHVDAVRFMTGDEELKSMQGKLEAAQYPMEFPAGSAAKIVRRGKLTCHHNIGCSVELLPPGQVAMRMY